MGSAVGRHPHRNDSSDQPHGARGWQSFPIVLIEVWHEWKFSPQGIRPGQPKWVNTTNTQAYLPTLATTVPNLVLAGAHTRTAADVWSIEAAVESAPLGAILTGLVKSFISR